MRDSFHEPGGLREDAVHVEPIGKSAVGAALALMLSNLLLNLLGGIHAPFIKWEASLRDTLVMEWSPVFVVVCLGRGR